MLKIRVKSLAELIFNNIEQLPHFDFYIEKDSCGGYSWAYRLEVMEFADSVLVIGNYYGGGSPFCIDITGDSDSSALHDCLRCWLIDNDCDNEDGEPIVYADLLDRSGDI